MRIMEFKIYSNKEDFLNDNLDIKTKDFYEQVELSFFYKNILDYQQFNNDSYAFKFWDKNDYLLVLKIPNRNLLLYGQVRLANFAANTLADYYLHVSNALGKNDLVLEFFKAYQKRLGIKITYQRDMSILCNNEIFKKEVLNNNVIKLANNEVEELVHLHMAFCKEELKQDLSYEESLKSLKSSDDIFYAYKLDGKYISMARKRKAYGKASCISGVYTLPEYRNNGYAYEVISTLLADNSTFDKGAYLFVENDNITALGLYQKLGFKFYLKQTQIDFVQTNIKQVLFAGGCFWCMAKPYYEYDGILKVFSGYAGGNEINPTYEMVKKGLTHHRETVMLEYNEDIISYQELLDIYFSTIDPFDEGGQFIDRGDNYTCAVYTSNLFNRNLIEEFIKKIENDFKRPVFVKLLDDVVFYKAEEYHQDYALKNPELMAEELEKSGRLG